MMINTDKTESKHHEDKGFSDSKIKIENNEDINKNSFSKSKRKVRFNSFSDSLNNPLYKKSDNSILFKNYFGDSFDYDDDEETENNHNIKTESNTLNREKDNPNDYSIVLNISQDKILFNNLQYDSMFIHDIDPFKEKSIHKNQTNSNFTGNILDELKEEEMKENENSSNENYKEFYTDISKKEKRTSVKFDEEQINNHKNNSKSNRSKKEKKNNKGKSNETTRELLKNKFLKFIKKYASNSKNYSLSDDVEIEKSFYNFYDENFGKNGIDLDASICTYEKHDGSRYNVTVNDLFDDRNEFDEFKNSIYINKDDINDTLNESTITRSTAIVNSKSGNTSFRYNPSFIYDHNSLEPDYEDTMNYLCYNISTCIDDDHNIMNDEEKNKKMNENILAGIFDDEEEEKEQKEEKTTNNNNDDEDNKKIIKMNESKTITNKGKSPENSKLKENLKTFMESEAFKQVINNPDTFTIFLKSILIGYVSPEKIDKTKDKLFKMIDKKEIEQIKKFVIDYVDIIEKSEDKISDMREKSILIETKKNSGEVVEQTPGFITRFNEIMIEKFTSINNAIINFTTELCPQIIKNGINSLMKSIPVVVSVASLIPVEYITSLLSSFPAGQTILNTINEIIMKSSFLASSHMILPQIAIIIGCLYKNLSSGSSNNENTSRGENNSFLPKFLNFFEIFSNNLKNDGGLDNTEKDPSAITSKLINAVFKTMTESKDVTPLFDNEKINTIMNNLVSNLPESDNKLKTCLSILNETINKDNETSKSLFDELINLLDREKLSDEDFSKILTLIIKGSEKLPLITDDKHNENEEVAIKSLALTNEPLNNCNTSSIDLDKSYSVIMLSQVLDELKKSKGETEDNQVTIKEKTIKSQIKNEAINSSENKNVVHEYKKNRNLLNSDRKIKMKTTYKKRSYSLTDKTKRDFYENPQAEFVVRNIDSKNNAEFSIRRGESNNQVEHIIPKYYSSSPSITPNYYQRRYKSYDERQLDRCYSDNEVQLSKKRLDKKEKNNGFYNLYMKNEWNDEDENQLTENKKSQDYFFLESKGLNIGDSFINDDVFTFHSKEKGIEVNQKMEENSSNNKISLSTENIFEESSNSSTIKGHYSINSDDTYDKLFLSNALSSSNTSSEEGSLNNASSSDKSKKSKKSKEGSKSFKQMVMKHFTRNGSKRAKPVPKYIEWENLPLEIIFNIFKHFSIEELAKLREVSKYFNYILTNPVFYMNINLTNESDTIDNEMLFYQLKYSNGYLLSLNLSQCNIINENVFKDAIDYKIQNRNINDKVVNERASLCFNDKKTKFEKEESLVQNLRNLDLSYCTGIYSSQTMCNFFKGISIQPDGHIIKKNGCINLEELNLCDLYQILDDDLLLSIAEGCPNLKKLYISKGYDITNYGVKMILRKCKHLELLKLVNCPRINYEAFDTRHIEEISILTENITYDLNLKSLNISYCRMMEDNSIKMIAENCPFLEELYISGCQNISDEGMKHLVLGRAWKDKRIKILDISGCYCIGDKGIETLTPSELIKLDISDCSFITDTGLRYIHDGMPLLEEIGYENCSGTSSSGRDKLLSKYLILTKTE